MTRRTARRRTKRPDGRQRGYILVWFAAMMVVLLAFAGFAVDLGYWYLEGRNAQRTADAAALSGVVYREGDISNNDAARDAALATATENGYTKTDDDTDVTVYFDDANGSVLPLSQLRVEVERKAPSFFTRLLGFNGVDMSRDATAEYAPSPPLGSPSNLLGNEPVIGGDSSWVDPAVDLGQSFWLDIHGPRSSTVEGDQYQTDRCNNLSIPQGEQQTDPPPFTLPNPAFTWIGPFTPEACDPATGTNEYYEDGGGKDGYNYIVEVSDVDPANPGSIDLELFDPAFLDQGADCLRYTIDGSGSLGLGEANPKVIFPLDVVLELGLLNTPKPLRFSLATWNKRALSKVSGPIAGVAQAILDDGMLNPATPPVDPNIQFPPFFGIYPAPIYNVLRWNLYATLTNYGVTESMMQDVVERFAPGPFEPGCTGDDATGANLVLSPGLAFLGCLFGGCGGGGWIGGTAATEPAEIAPIQPADPGNSPPIGTPESPSGDTRPSDPAIPFAGDTVFAASAVNSAAVPLRPARTDFTQFDGLPETRFLVTEANGTLRDHTDNRDVSVCPGENDDAATYGWYSPFVPTAAALATSWDQGGSGYFWNYVFNGLYSKVVPPLFDISFGEVTYGQDITAAATFWPGGVHELGHNFRDTARKWVKPCGSAIPIDPSWITSDGKVQLVINADTGIRDGGTTTQLCNSDTTTCGRGGNRFAIRAQHDGSGDGVNVYADGRLQILGNFQGSNGDFWLTELPEDDTRDRVLRLTFHDPGDISVCQDVVPPIGKVDPDPDPNDNIADVLCSPAGYALGDADVPNDVVGTLRILQPNGDIFPDCEIVKVSDPDTVLNPGDDCEITTLDYSFNGDLLQIRIMIPKDGFHCDGDPEVDPTACWIVAEFDYPGSTPGQLVRPSDATSWSAILEGVPVRLVE
ncbi:MAG: Tad domain-containing protein [Acidimicrobiia bacterium]|nr:Tad domain-containing protein [Acidimicrobiia bacterium]